MAACDDLRPMLAAFADGQLGALERDGVDAHLARCGRCRQIVMDQQRIQHVLGAYQPPPVTEARWAEVGRRLRTELEGKGRPAVLKTRARTESLEPTPPSQAALREDELEEAEEVTPPPIDALKASVTTAPAARFPSMTVLRVRSKRPRSRFAWAAHAVGAMAAALIITLATSSLWLQRDLGPIALASPRDVAIMDLTMTDPNYSVVVDSGDACDVVVVWVVPNPPEG